jgi:MoaA/NifB/PqqE/SkfB family radical SAM enzyme
MRLKLMKLVHKTVSLCDKCYKHIPGNVIEENGQILLKKVCPEHGMMTSVVEPDVEFYYGLKHYKGGPLKEFMEPMLFEVTDRCQLNCPHCYHLPDNKTVDVEVSEIQRLLNLFPKTCYPMLAGAEPTLRNDFVDVCKLIKSAGHGKTMVLTNGLRFADKKFARNSAAAGLTSVCLGLNHPSYQGQKVHDKQLRAIDNLIEQNLDITYIGYTMQSLDELPFILSEIKMLDSKMTSSQQTHYRIRCGSFIGRSNDQRRSYLSATVKYVKDLLGDEIQHCYDENTDEFALKGADDNPYHVIMKWGNTIVRLIQWPDVTNIDMEELNTGPWCHFYEGPITNFVHQVITRDAFKNMGLPMLDQVPMKYRYQPYAEKTYWRDNWSGVIEVKDLEFNWESQETTPIRIPQQKIIQIKNYEHSK